MGAGARAGPGEGRAPMEPDATEGRGWSPVKAHREPVGEPPPAHPRSRESWRVYMSRGRRTGPIKGTSLRIGCCFPA